MTEGKPISQMSDKEVGDYIAFTLETWSHLQGALGALSPELLQEFAKRLRMMGHAKPWQMEKLLVLRVPETPVTTPYVMDTAVDRVAQQVTDRLFSSLETSSFKDMYPQALENLNSYRPDMLKDVALVVSRMLVR